MPEVLFYSGLALMGVSAASGLIALLILRGKSGAYGNGWTESMVPLATDYKKGPVQELSDREKGC